MIQTHQLHLLFLALWGGVVLTESVIELWGRRREELLRPTIIFHYWIDLLIEAPIILGVLASGLLLLLSLDRLVWLHALKVTAALLAISANAYCILQVIGRYRAMRAGADSAQLLARTRRVFLSAAAGMPFAAVAVGLGFWLTLQSFQAAGILKP
jgi:hypothetical protein